MFVCIARPDDNHDHNDALLSVRPTRARPRGCVCCVDMHDRRPRTRSPRSYQAAVEPAESPPRSKDYVEGVHYQVGPCCVSSAPEAARVHVAHGSGPYPSGVYISGSKQLSHDGADAGVVPRREDHWRIDLRGERGSLSHVRVRSRSFVCYCHSLARHFLSPSAPCSIALSFI